jgi:hypothetical protein
MKPRLPGVSKWNEWKCKANIITLIKKKNKKIPIYKEIQKVAVAKSYMTNGLLIYD